MCSIFFPPLHSPEKCKQRLFPRIVILFTAEADHASNFLKKWRWWEVRRCSARTVAVCIRFLSKIQWIDNKDWFPPPGDTIYKRYFVKPSAVFTLNHVCWITPNQFLFNATFWVRRRNIRGTEIALIHLIKTWYDPTMEELAITKNDKQPVRQSVSGETVEGVK